MDPAARDRDGLQGPPHGHVVAGVLGQEPPGGPLRRLAVVDDPAGQVPGARFPARALPARQQDPAVLVTYLPVRSYPELHPSTVRRVHVATTPIRSCPGASR
nr:hypothetical protein GCM10025732_01300 [Glycomyces mayteni]